VVELWEHLRQLVLDLAGLAVQLLALALRWSLLLFWLALSLGGINWKKTWPVLAKGGWAPLVLLMLLVALVWSRIAPADCDCLGFLRVTNFWWQLGEVSLFVALTLFCGWLQGVFAWTPPEVNLEPPAHAVPHHGEDAHHY
jgi:hypothetical protein